MKNLTQLRRNLNKDKDLFLQLKRKIKRLQIEKLEPRKLLRKTRNKQGKRTEQESVV